MVEVGRLEEADDGGPAAQKQYERGTAARQAGRERTGAGERRTGGIKRALSGDEGGSIAVTLSSAPNCGYWHHTYVIPLPTLTLERVGG